MKKIIGLLLLCAAMLPACTDNRGTATRSDSETGAGRGSTNVGMVPGSGRVDTGGGVTAGDSPSKPEAAVTGTSTYEQPGTNRISNQTQPRPQ